MKRVLVILFLGVVLGGLGGAAVYFARTSSTRAMLCCKNPELAWLQHEFQMTDAQLAQVQKLDAAYQAGCAEMCGRINATNELVRQQFAGHAAPTPEMAQLLGSAAQLRSECQLNMLTYCYAVSREMPLNEGQRYLKWVSDQILALPRESGMQMRDPNLPGHGN